MRKTALSLTAAFLFFCGSAFAGGPHVFWSAEPVAPDETAMLQGSDFGEHASVMLSRLADQNGEAVGASQPVRILDSNERSLRFVIPSDWKPGVFACRVHTASGDTELLLNAPQVWWMQADRGQNASPGGWLRVFGRSLCITKAKVELRREGGSRPLDVTESDTWHVAAVLPSDLTPGEHEVWINNGCGAPHSWVNAGKLQVISPPPARKEFRLTDFGATPDDDADDSDALNKTLAAAAADGGGTIRLGRGRLRLHGGFTLPPHVSLLGEGQDATYLTWADTADPPAAFLEASQDASIRDLSLFAGNYRIGIRAAAKDADGKAIGARDVAIQRVRVRFTPLSVPNLKPPDEMARRIALSHSAVFQLDGDNTAVVDCDLAFTTNIGFALQGNYTLCTGNTVHSEAGGWCPVGGGRDAIVERNAFDGITTGVTRGKNVWFAHNRVTHVYGNFREGFTTDGIFGGPGFIDIAKTEAATLTLAKDAYRSDPPSIPAAVRVIDGTGVGQFRDVVSFDGRKLVMDRPWDVTPDAKSLIWAANDMGHHLVVGNEWSDCGIATQLYGGALDCVVAGNRSVRSGGFRAWGNDICWYVQFLNNRIAEGYGTEGAELNAGRSSIHVVGPWVEGFKRVTARGIVIRGNRLDNNATITLRAEIDDVLIERNVIRDSVYGIVGDLWDQQHGVLLRQNSFERVREPMSPKEINTQYRTAQK